MLQLDSMDLKENKLSLRSMQWLFTQCKILRND